MRLPGFYKLSINERRKILMEKGILEEEDIHILEKGLSLEKANAMVENVIGIYSLPFGIAPNFKINGKEKLVPMVIEEPSVIAAASRAAKEALPLGFTAKADPPIMIGEIFIKGDVPEASKLKEKGEDALSHLKKYGCGIENVKIKYIGGEKHVIYFYVNVGNAQGANIINSMLEEVSEHIKAKIIMRIVSNLALFRKVKAKAFWEEGKGVVEAYRCALADIYRCVTHNKGIMNGIDAVAVATGNDWRSIEAGAHGFASLNYYKPLTSFYEKGGGVVGEIELPIAVGTVGFAVKSNPLAKLAIKIAGVKNAQELAEMMACVGLANNYAALSALANEGIQTGHMRLHARRIAIEAGAKGEQIEKVARILAKERNFNIEHAKRVLEEFK